MFDHQWYEGTIITYCHERRNYGIYWEDGDSEVGDLSVTLRRIEDWYVKTGQQAVGARIQSGAPFALMHFHHDSLERKAAMRGAFPFLASKHALGLSFQLRDHPLTTCELSPELQQCLGTALDKILLMCESFPVGSDEVYILRNFASILPQLLFAYGTRYPQVRRAVDAFNQGKWEDLWKQALKAGERAKDSAAKNPRLSKGKSAEQQDKYSQKCARAGNLSKAAATLYKSSLSTSFACSTLREIWTIPKTPGHHCSRRLSFGRARKAGIYLGTHSAFAT